MFVRYPRVISGLWWIVGQLVSGLELRWAAAGWLDAWLVMEKREEMLMGGVSTGYRSIGMD